MPRLNIEFDLDGILINYLSCLIYFLEKRGIKHIPNGTFNFDTEPALTPKVMQICVDAAMRDVENIHPMPGAIDTIQALWGHTGDPIKITTARPMENIYVTMECIEKVLGKIPYFFAMLDNMDDKPNYVRSKCYIDDRRRNAETMASRGYTVFMPRREYNMPIFPADGYAVFDQTTSRVEHAGIWKKTDGMIIVIKDIRCLLHPENLKLIIS